MLAAEPIQPVPQRRPRQAGFTLIELLIASVILVFGVLSLATLVALAVKNNGHSRLDSSATMLNQAVVEQVINLITNRSLNTSPTTALDTSTTMTDCNGTGTTWTVASEGPGSPLCTTVNSLCSYDDIGNKVDFTQAKVDGYHMDYQICQNSRTATYDVRWNIQAVTGRADSELLTVTTRLKGDTTIINFPITMRVWVGP